MIFRKVNEAQVSAESVTLMIKRSDNGDVRGRVVTMVVTHAGLEPKMQDEAILEAIRSASELAETTKQGVVHVVDEDGLWQSDWGALRDAGTEDAAAKR